MWYEERKNNFLFNYFQFICIFFKKIKNWLFEWISYVKVNLMWIYFIAFRKKKKSIHWCYTSLIIFFFFSLSPSLLFLSLALYRFKYVNEQHKEKTTEYIHYICLRYWNITKKTTITLRELNRLIWWEAATNTKRFDKQKSKK